jgi:proline iminopeptidase
MDLLGHSAGANVAVQYAARYPENTGKLVLITPGTAAVGITVTGGMRRGLARLRKDEPWFPAAFAALEAITGGTGSDWAAIALFFWGRWDAAARNHPASKPPSNKEAVAHFAAEGAFDPAATRAALAAHEGPVLVLAGEFDVNSPPAAMAELAGLFPAASLVVQPGAAHYPWLDDADRFEAATAAFLR